MGVCPEYGVYGPRARRAVAKRGQTATGVRGEKRDLKDGRGRKEGRREGGRKEGRKKGSTKEGKTKEGRKERSWVFHKSRPLPQPPRRGVLLSARQSPIHLRLSFYLTPPKEKKRL